MFCILFLLIFGGFWAAWLLCWEYCLGFISGSIFKLGFMCTFSTLTNIRFSIIHFKSLLKISQNFPLNTYLPEILQHPSILSLHSIKSLQMRPKWRLSQYLTYMIINNIILFIIHYLSSLPNSLLIHWQPIFQLSLQNKFLLDF